MASLLSTEVAENPAGNEDSTLGRKLTSPTPKSCAVLVGSTVPIDNVAPLGAVVSWWLPTVTPPRSEPSRTMPFRPLPRPNRQVAPAAPCTYAGCTVAPPGNRFANVVLIPQRDSTCVKLSATPVYWSASGAVPMS